ncbi:hypothetical protein ACP70R_008266 [Stipagrostis hirtigluma subsp. patula]
MEGGRDGFLGVARAPPPPAAASCSSFLGSTTSSGGARMLSFSSNGAAGVGSELRGQQHAGGSGKSEGAIHSNSVDGAGAPGPDLQAFCCECTCAIQSATPHQKKPPSMELGWAPFRPGCADAEPGRCRRTDGKKWRCSRDAVGDQKYCERHLNRGRHRSRKHVEGQKATSAIAGSAMTVPAPGGVSSRIHNVSLQQEMKSSASNVTDPFQRESNRKLDKHIHDQLLSTSMDFFNFSPSQSSPNCNKVAQSPVELQYDHEQAYFVHGEDDSAEKGNKLLESQLLVSKETTDDGPLGEVFKSKSCQSASEEILTDKWTATRNLHSPTGILQMTSNFSSVSGSNTVPVENHARSDCYLTARKVNSQAVPTFL